MANPYAYNLWIEKGYEIFAEEGPDGLLIERLARILNLNKSGFYHYFGDRDTFIEQLLKRHQALANELIEEYKLIDEFDPGFIKAMLKFKNAVLFHMQLVRYRQIGVFYNCYHKINVHVDKAAVRTFSKFIGLGNNPELAHKYFMQARDMFYSRVTRENLNEEFLRELIYEVREVAQKIQNQAVEGNAD